MQDVKPFLHKRAEFEAVLSEYEVSDRVKKILASTPCVVLSGVAGGGRNTVIKYLVDQYSYGFIVSDTTRPPKLRDGQMEQEGVNYYFRNEEDLLQDLKNGEFVEAELIHNQQVSGTSIREVQRIIAMGKTPILDCEFGGANAIAEAKPDAVIIGLLPPSYDEWMRRLAGREEMHSDELRNRLMTAETVLQNMLSKPYFRFVVNDTVENCAESINAIVNHSETHQNSESARIIAGDLLNRVKETLAKS